MESYRWTCSACETVNEPNATECVQCGCPALANVDDVEASLDPAGYKRKKAKGRYAFQLIAFMYIPAVAVSDAFASKVVSLFFLNVIAVYLVIGGIELLRYIWGSMWARNSLLFVSSLLVFAVIASAKLTQEEFPYLDWLNLSCWLPAICTYLYVFKSKKGDEVFDEYYKKYYETSENS